MPNQSFDYKNFSNLTFADFKKRALDPKLTTHEKIGFPNVYREGKEDAIFKDILQKLTHLQSENKNILDIGSGCGDVTLQLIKLCEQKKHRLFLIDSEEMLQQLPDADFITKIPAFYPNQCKEFIRNGQQKIDVILTYSVLQYIFVEANLFEFIDDSLSLLAEGGQFLLGDIPNASKRKRFLNGTAGKRYHQKHIDPATLPVVEHFVIEAQQIDDAVLLSILMRVRQAGFDAYLMPQSIGLPFANRREDLLILKP